MFFVIQNVISEGAGGERISQYKSIIYYHEDRPRWFETIKVEHRVISPVNHVYLLFVVVMIQTDKEDCLSVRDHP